jgi:heptosyltransferase-2
VVAIFGPTNPAWSETYSEREIVVRREVPCGPCGARECPEGHHACMRQLGVEEVFAAVERALALGVAV